MCDAVVVCSALSKISILYSQALRCDFFFNGKSAQFDYRTDFVLWKMYFLLLQHSFIRSLFLSHSHRYVSISVSGLSLLSYIHLFREIFTSILPIYKKNGNEAQQSILGFGR